MKTAYEVIDKVWDEFVEQGISPGEAARKAQVSYTTAYQWRSGRCKPTVETALALLHALGLDLAIVKKGDAT